jgi:anaphase-promoting complex subunit 4
MPEVPLVIHRARYLTSEGGEGPVALALNGKKGRRVGCVMNGQEGEVEVWDMEDDEGDEEEEGDEEGLEEEGKEDESM